MRYGLSSEFPARYVSASHQSGELRSSNSMLARFVFGDKRRYRLGVSLVNTTVSGHGHCIEGLTHFYGPENHSLKQILCYPYNWAYCVNIWIIFSVDLRYFLTP